MAVSREQVFAAAAELQARGEKPTIEAVRQITGGSYTTISPALNEWKARQSAATAALREPTPQVVAERLADLGSELWALALDVANTRLAKEREGLEKIRVELEADRNEAMTLADKLAGDVELLKSRQTSLEAAEALARGETAELRERLAKAQEQAHTAEARAQEIDRRAGELRMELDRAHQDAAAARQAREEVARLAGQVAALKEHSAALLARITPPKGKASN
ncbi:DNA-binding protein [Xanthomonas campestris pv. campestris]|nr:DNA-binding protein [Xanthomonas campestris pv. campestris]